MVVSLCALAEKCPYGKSWIGRGDAASNPHDQLVECSNAGQCDYSIGVCDCVQGFEGVACDRAVGTPSHSTLKLTRPASALRFTTT